jgi:hypothetical protein
MLEYLSKFRRVIGGPVLRYNNCGMVTFAARPQYRITHYPDFGDGREANAVVVAFGPDLLDTQSDLRLHRNNGLKDLVS